MKRESFTIILHLLVTLFILCGTEFLFGKCVLHKVMTKQDSLIWSLYLGGSVVIVILAIIINCLLNRIWLISPNWFMVVNILGALISCVIYVLLSNGQDRALLDYVDYKNETDYFVMVILSILVFLFSVLGNILWRILYHIVARK